jgi:hypothetical protein
MSENHFSETPEAAAFALFKEILEADPTLTSRTSNQPIAAYMLDLYAECLVATNGDRKPQHEREMLQ